MIFIKVILAMVNVVSFGGSPKDNVKVGERPFMHEKRKYDFLRLIV
jgi:hypothetical protein